LRLPIGRSTSPTPNTKRSGPMDTMQPYVACGQPLLLLHQPPLMFPCPRRSVMCIKVQSGYTLWAILAQLQVMRIDNVAVGDKKDSNWCPTLFLSPLSPHQKGHRSGLIAYLVLQAQMPLATGDCYSASSQTVNSTSKGSTPLTLNAATKEQSDRRRISRSGSRSR
jgi:hypothetical protein